VTDDIDDMAAMEPDMATTAHMKFVDNRCGCCPYGYHIDIDFLRYLDSLSRSANVAVVVVVVVARRKLCQISQASLPNSATYCGGRIVQVPQLTTALHCE